MAALIIHAHPIENSYSSVLRDAVLQAMTAAKVDHTVVRLCQGDPAGVAVLEGVHHLVVVAPTWWGGMPAQLLDWVQQLVGPLIDQQAALASPLAGVRTLTVISTHGSTRLKNRVQGEPGLQLWKRVVLPLCSADAAFRWVALYDIDRGGALKREEFVGRVWAEVTSALSAA